MTWGIIPAAGIGSRIQPLAFSKELLPVGSRLDGGVERPRAVSEYLVERMVRGGATRICFVISPTKSDIIEYFGGGVPGASFAYVVQPTAHGLCDAIFQALPLMAPDDPVIVGLPDTIWFPEDALAKLPDDRLTFLCFPVDQPQHFDAVVADPRGRVREIQVKRPDATSHWIWGAFKLPARTLRELAELWREPGRGDPYIGTLVNAWLARGGEAYATRTGTGYVDVGTLHGWRDAVHLLEGRAGADAPRPYRAEVVAQAQAQATTALAAPGDRIDAFARGAPVGRVLVVAAHPDDEVLGAGAALALQPEVTIVHLTDGVPADPWFMRQAGCATRVEYARLRDRELTGALAALGLDRARRHRLDAIDQLAAEALPTIVPRLAELIATERPALIVTHAYEGGHPDHDAAAFAVRAALARLPDGAPRPTVAEMGGYRAGDGDELRFDLPPRDGVVERRRELSAPERARKGAALAHFASQREVIARLAWDVERFRAAGEEDFGRPPEGAAIHYDRHGWPIDGARLRALIAAAGEGLGVGVVLGC